MRNPNSPNNTKPPIRKKMFTPEQFLDRIDEWIEYVENKTIKVDVPKANPKTGEALVMNRPEPPLIESFCIYAKIDEKTFWNYSKGQGYEAYFHHARKLRDWCNAMILKYMMLGYITDNAGKFYLVNNSRYADKSEVVQVDSTSIKPSWLSGPQQPPQEQKSLPHEAIPFEDVQDKKE